MAYFNFFCLLKREIRILEARTHADLRIRNVGWTVVEVHFSNHVGAVGRGGGVGVYIGTGFDAGDASEVYTFRQFLALLLFIDFCMNSSRIFFGKTSNCLE
jgi:hypothetical protein